MTAHEKQDERVIPFHGSVIAELRPGISCRLGRELLTIASRRFAAEKIGHAARRHMNEPAARVVGNPFLRPLHACGDERFLHRIFGGRKIFEASNHGAENLRCDLAQQVLGIWVQAGSRHTSTGGALITSRTSIGIFSGTPPLPGAADAAAAISYARAGLSTSTIQ